MIQFFQVTKYFDRYAALRDVTLRVDKGECVLLTGPSGAGKTTLLKLIFGAEVPDEGQILVQNRNIARLRASDVPYLRRTMGFVLQDFKLLPQKTVFENVALPLIIQGTAGLEVRRKGGLPGTTWAGKQHNTWPDMASTTAPAGLMWFSARVMQPNRPISSISRMRLRSRAAIYAGEGTFVEPNDPILSGHQVFRSVCGVEGCHPTG